MAAASGRTSAEYVAAAAEGAALRDGDRDRDRDRAKGLGQVVT